MVQGIHTRDLAEYFLSRVHRDENELLADMLELMRISTLCGLVSKFLREERSSTKRDMETTPLFSNGADEAIRGLESQRKKCLKLS